MLIKLSACDMTYDWQKINILSWYILAEITNENNDYIKIFKLKKLKDWNFNFWNIGVKY